MNSFAGGLADGINSGVNLVFAKERIDASRAQREALEEERQRQREQREKDDAYGREVGELTDKIGTDVTTYKLKDPAAADNGPPVPAAVDSSTRKYGARDYTLDLSKTAGKYGMAEKASNAALAAFAQDRSAALMKAAATGDMDAFAREYNAIPDGYTMRSGVNPKTGKYDVAMFDKDGNIGTSAGGQPLVRSFDNSDEALGMLAASAGDPKAVTEWLKAKRTGDVNLEKALLAQEASMARTNAAYGARQGSSTRSGGGSPDKPKDPYSGISLKDAKDIYGDERPEFADAWPLYHQWAETNKGVEGAQNESAHLAVLNQIMKKVAAGEKPATEIDQNTGDWIHGFHQFPTAENGAQGAFITLRRDQDPEPGFVQQNGGTITKEQQEAFLAARQNWLNDFSARVGQDAYAGLSMAALNGGPVAERITALRNSSPAARAAYNAMHNIQVLSKMPANEQKARPTGTDKDPKFTPQELEAASAAGVKPPSNDVYKTMFDSVSGAASGAVKAIGTSSFDQHLQKMRSLRERGVFDKSDAYVIENFVKGDPERLKQLTPEEINLIEVSIGRRLR